MVNLRVILLMILNLYCVDDGAAVQVFFREEFCMKEEEQLLANCIEKVEDIRSGNNIECVAKCDDAYNCTGASLNDVTRVCFKHYLCSVAARFTCGTGVGAEDKHLFFSKNCNHGGQWQPATNSCKCVSTPNYNYWVGETCSRYPYYSTEILQYGYSTGSYSMMIDIERDGKPILTSVSISDTGVSYRILETLGASRSSDNWESYGIGFIKRHLRFLGMRGWSKFTQQGATTLSYNVDNWGAGKPSGRFMRYYTGMKMKGESDGYSFTFDTTYPSDTASGDNSLKALGFYLGDCFGPYQNTSFSTYDRDQDGNSSINCASYRASGWWLPPDCNTHCNLFGDSPWYWGRNQPLAERVTIPGYNMSFLEGCTLRVKLFAIGPHPILT